MNRKKGLLLLALCAFLLCSCGGEKEETGTAAQTAKFETTSNTETDETTESESEPGDGGESEPSVGTEPTGGGMVILDEIEIGETTDGVIDFGE